VVHILTAAAIAIAAFTLYWRHRRVASL